MLAYEEMARNNHSYTNMFPATASLALILYAFVANVLIALIDLSFHICITDVIVFINHQPQKASLFVDYLSYLLLQSLWATLCDRNSNEIYEGILYFEEAHMRMQAVHKLKFWTTIRNMMFDNPKVKYVIITLRGHSKSMSPA